MMRSTPAIGVKLQVISSLQSPIYRCEILEWFWLVHFFMSRLPSTGLCIWLVFCNSVSILKAHPRSASAVSITLIRSNHCNAITCFKCVQFFRQSSEMLLRLRAQLMHAVSCAEMHLQFFVRVMAQAIRDLQDTYFKMIMHNLSIYYNYLCDSMQFSNALRCNEKKMCVSYVTRRIPDRFHEDALSKYERKRNVFSQPPIQYQNSFVEKCERDQYILQNHVAFFFFC